MKQLLCLLLVCGMTFTKVNAQAHLKGQRFYEIQAGLINGFQLTSQQPGLNLLLSTGKYNKQYNAWKATVGFVQKKHAQSMIGAAPLINQLSLGWGYEFNIWRNPIRTRFIRGVAQPVLLYESFGSTQKNTVDSTQTSNGTSRLLLGGDVGLDIEWSPVVLSIRQRWQPKSTNQPFHTLFSVGWRFHR